MANFLEIEKHREAIKSKLPNQLNISFDQIYDSGQKKKTSFTSNSETDVTSNIDKSTLNTSLQLIKSSKGKDKLLLNGIPFYKNKAMSNGNIYWKCQFYRSKQCSSRAITKDMKLVSCTSHNHTSTLVKEEKVTRPEILKKKHQLSNTRYTNDRLVNRDIDESIDSIDHKRNSESKLLEDSYSSSDNEIANYQKSRKYNTLGSCKRNFYNKVSSSKKIKTNSIDTNSDTTSDHSISNASSSKYMSDFLLEDYGIKEWDDPNVLVDRLRILTSPTNTNLHTTKEIDFIISELREAGYIY